MRINYKKVEADLRKRISEQEWNIGEKIPSCREFSQYYGCSVNTIEKALKELQQLGLILREERKGSVISPKVQFAKPGGLVAAFVLGIDNPLWTSALRGIEDYLHTVGVSMIPVSHEQDSAKMRQALESMVNFHVQGAIISPIDHGENDRRQFYEIIQTLLNNGVKLVFIDRFRHDLNIPYVTSDNASASYKLTKLLIENGHRQIGFVRTTHISTIAERFAGFKQACYESDIPAGSFWDFFIQTEDEDFRNELDAFSNQVEHKLAESGVTALFASNDQIAKALIQTLQRLHYRIPEDISIVTYDVANIHESYPFTLTGVKQNFYGMGRLAADLLMDLICTNSPGNVQLGHVFPSDIVIGNSVRNLLEERHTEKEGEKGDA